MPRKTVLGILFVFAFLAAAEIHGQAGGGEPAWLVYQQGLDAFRKGDFGQAIKVVKRMNEIYGEIPEAHLLQARVYEQEGEYQLAEKYYNRALELRKQLYVLEDKYTILYRLAEIYRIQKRYRDFEIVLLEILKDQDTFSNPRFARLRDSYVKAVSEEGFDQLVTLYRMKADFSQKAHSELGILYCRTGRSYQAVLNLVFASLPTVTTLVEELKQHDPDFAFKSLEETLETASRRQYLADYLRDADFFKDAYYLASSLYAHGIKSEAKTLWKIVAAHGHGEWKTRSRNQLLSPQSESLILY